MSKRLVTLGWILISAACAPPSPDAAGDAGLFRPVVIGGPETLAEACAELLGAVCEYRVRCGEIHDAAWCRAALAEQGFPADCLRAQSSVDAGRARYEPGKAQRCLDALRKSGSCTSHAGVPECQSLVEGGVAAGGVCFETSECEDDAFCDTSAACPAVCKRKVRPQDAARPTDVCVPGHYVYGGKCIAYARRGDSCAPLDGGFFRRSCGPDWACDAMTLTCGALGMPYSPCSSSLECERNLFCDGRYCRRYAELGARCHPRGVDGPLCRWDLVCVSEREDEEGTCWTRAKADRSCWTNAECPPDQVCDRPRLSQRMGLCRAGAPVGASCSSLPCDANGDCVNDVCHARRGDGAACQPD